MDVVRLNLVLLMGNGCSYTLRARAPKRFLPEPVPTPKEQSTSKRVLHLYTPTRITLLTSSPQILLMSVVPVLPELLPPARSSSNEQHEESPSLHSMQPLGARLDGGRAVRFHGAIGAPLVLSGPSADDALWCTRDRMGRQAFQTNTTPRYLVRIR